MIRFDFDVTCVLQHVLKLLIRTSMPVLHRVFISLGGMQDNKVVKVSVWLKRY